LRGLPEYHRCHSRRKKWRAGEMIQFQFVRPSSAKAAVEALARDPKAQFIAGGTNLVDLMKMGVAAPEKLVDINHLPLRDITQQAKSLRIGALALNSDVADNELVHKGQPLLAQALKAGASPQLRNMATVGGNLLQRTRCPYFFDIATPCNKREPGTGCSALGGYNRMHAIFGTTENCIAVHPSDMCIALRALDAVVLVSGPKGERIIPISDFHRLPGNTPQLDNNLQRGELITAVDIPNNSCNKSYYLKIRDRASYAFALVSVGVAANITGGQFKEIRMAMGGVAHKPWRLSEAETFLKGKAVSAANIKEAAHLAMKGAKGYGQNNFKLTMAPNAIIEALQTIAEM
jgi:xanthine dehydrogenase YagS FAD-binding subunit